MHMLSMTSQIKIMCHPGISSRTFCDFLLTDQDIPQQVKTSARSQKMSKDVYIKKYILHYLIMYINIIEDINK